MAEYGKIVMKKLSGGVLNVTATDGATSTDLVLPLSGTVASVGGAVTDNAIARYDGTTGKLQNSGVIIDDNGNLLLTSGSGGLGYGTGSGGTVTQLTSRSTAVTLNKPTGTIFTYTGTIQPNELIWFTLNNSLIEYTDGILLNIGGVALFGQYQFFATFGNNGRCIIYLRNIYAQPLTENISLKFTIIKGAIS